MRRLWATLAVAALLVACSRGSAAAVPHHLEAYVEGGRGSLEQNQDGLLRSTFVFHDARCRKDGGLVVIFDQRGILGSEGFAFAISGDPQSDPGAWGGGFGVVDPATDNEIAYFLATGGGEVRCAQLLYPVHY